MNFKRLLLAASSIFLFALLWNALVHLVILREANLALAAIARPAPDRSLILSLLQTAGVSVVFLFSYVLFRRSGTLKEGLGLGAMFGVFAGLLVDLNQYILYPIPGALAAAWFAFGLVEFCAYGMLCASLCRVSAQPYGQPVLAQKKPRKAGYIDR